MAIPNDPYGGNLYPSPYIYPSPYEEPAIGRSEYYRRERQREGMERLRRERQELEDKTGRLQSVAGYYRRAGHGDRYPLP